MKDGVYIDGKWRSGKGAAFTKHCPATGEISWEGRSADAAEVAEAVASARAAFPAWARTPVQERIAIMERYAEEIGNRAASGHHEGKDRGFRSRSERARGGAG